MPNIIILIDTIQQNINTNSSSETAYFSTMDIRYADSQLNLVPETTCHWNFSIISVECTVTYRFIAGFCAVTDMPAAYQKVMDYTLFGAKKHIVFLMI